VKIRELLYITPTVAKVCNRSQGLNI